MKTSKITEITNVNEWNKGEHGPIFYISMKMENGETITLGKKKKDSLKVGDTISYEENGEGKWKQIIEQQPQKKFNQEANNRGAMVGMSYRLAFELVYKGEDDFQKAVALAQRIFEEAMQTYNTHSKGEEALPF